MSLFKSFTKWSWSQLSTWRGCPYQARLRYLEHAPEPPKADNDPRDRGIAAHKAAEDFVLGTSTRLPKELVHFDAQLVELRDVKAAGSAEVHLEAEYLLDNTWRLTDDKERRWLKFIPDVHVVAPTLRLIIDYKTGRQYGNEVKHYQQMELYAIGDWCINPSDEVRTTELWYLDQKDIVVHEFRPEQLERGRAKLDEEVGRMMADKIHAPRPNKMNCKYCPFSPRGTGACAVGV
jgi:CRISPR/Cas system-associated exonuclease Cas4 (RecB family)